jgi:REP element-mobilizing transposase RayT
LDIVRCAETILAGVIPYYLVLFPKSQREEILDEVLKDVKDYVKEKKDIL